MPIDQESLKKDLLNMNENEFYIKHILKSRNWYFSQYRNFKDDVLIDKIDEFKEIISKNFNVSFHSVKMVGSAKVGFSLSPDKGLKEFHDGNSTEKASDIDVAIVSDRLYNEYWDFFRRENNVNYYFPLARTFWQVSSSIYKGFINSWNIREIDNMRKKWDAIVDPTNRALRERLFIRHEINYRLYRNWDDLREYQLNGIIEVQKKHKEKNGGDNV
ncbi:hypothetical protein [Fibrobacter sp. UWR2]|uniref:hypothetical protein n=1 Tax=Fibrobacter sp. UWR2 TaxID=1964352 RepID=UPI000B52240D|nr:hypothetical protein [Fibrobacter sp. UWR2]OWU98666.1 hypothetical protein B7994_13295 [Fibrobacter sp. UWR2]